MRPVDVPVLPDRARLLARLWTCAAVAVLCGSCDAVEQLTQAVASLEIGGAPEALAVGEVRTLSAVARDASGNPLEEKAVYWASRDTTIVRVDSAGTVRARVPGTARIVAVSEDKSDEVVIVVPHGPTVGVNAVVTDTLGVEDDVDEFRFQGTLNQEINVLLKGHSGAAAHRFRLRLLSPGGTVLDSVTSIGTDSVLRRQAIRWRRLTESGLYRLRIDGSFGTEKGAYQFRVERINTAPETAPDTVPVGDSVTIERLAPGDIDDFTFWGRNGEDYSLLFEARSKVPADALILRLLAPNRFERVFVHSNGDYTLPQNSGRVTLLQDGLYTVRVQGRFDAEDQGPYKFEMFRIIRQPERISRFITLDNNVGGERLEPQGDLDEFYFTITEQQGPKEVNVYLQSLTKNPADTMFLRVLQGQDTLGSLMSVGTDSAIGYTRAIGYLRLPPASYRVQVEGSRNTLGAYRFLVDSIHLPPERAADTLSYPAVVDTDSISPVGDVDEFTFRGGRDHRVLVGLRALSGSSSDVLRLYLYREDGTQITVLERNGAQASEDSYSWVLPATEYYRIRVQGVNSIDDGGRYQIRVVRQN